MKELKGFIELLTNNYFIIAILAWFIAQLLKFIISFVKSRSFDFRLFVASGGMPSSHSALVMGLTSSLGFDKGWDSPVTAAALIFSLVVMYDAAGVRRAAGKQAEILNKLIFDTSNDKQLTEQRLKELLGHTPIEVLTGALLGLLVGFLLM